MLLDFRPPAQIGRRPIDPTPEQLRLRDGLSVFATEAQAHRQARAYPPLGGYVVELTIPGGAEVTYERTCHTPGHHTLWAAPALLLGCVVRVVSVCARRRLLL